MADAPKFMPTGERKAKAAALLGPGVRDWKLNIAIGFVERAKHWRDSAIVGTLPRTGRQKELVSRAARELHKFRKTIADREFPPGVRDVITLESDGRLQGWFEYSQRVLDAGAKADTRRSQSDGAAKFEAARQAASLLRRQKLPVAITLTPRRSLYLRLAAILYGVENANLKRACSKAKQARTSSAR